MKVDFFIIGPPRCASTTLANFLANHPKVCFAKPKEPTYFCLDLPAGYDDMPQSIEEYHQTYFSHFNPSEHQITGEGTPLYLMSQCAISNILAYNPDAKIVALARNPIEIVYSMHATRVRVGLRHENITDFEEAWNAQEDRKKGLRLPQKAIREGVLQYRDLGSIGTQYERMLSLVPPENLHIIVYDDLKADMGAVKAKLLDFLELEPYPETMDSHKESNANWNNEFTRKCYFFLGSLSAKLPFLPKLGLLKALRSRSLKAGPRKGLRPEFRLHLREEFAAEISKFSDLLGRDFSHWK